MASSPITSWQLKGKKRFYSDIFYFLGLHETKRNVLLGRKAMTNIDNILKSGDITLLTKMHLVKAMLFPVVFYGYENWNLKKAEPRKTDSFQLCCWRKTLESPLDSKESKPVNSKGNQPLIFIGGPFAEAPILWSPNVKSWLIGKDSDAGKYWRQKEKEPSENEMVWVYHWLSGYEFEQTRGDGKREGSLGGQSTRLQRVERDVAAEQQQQDQKQKWPASQQIPHPAFSLLQEIMPGSGA